MIDVTLNKQKICPAFQTDLILLLQAGLILKVFVFKRFHPIYFILTKMEKLHSTDENAYFAAMHINLHFHNHLHCNATKYTYMALTSTKYYISYYLNSFFIITHLYN